MKRFFKLLAFAESRKVGFGLWLNITSGGFLLGGKISATDWLTTVFLSSALIGGGTILDTYLQKVHDKPPK